VSRKQNANDRYQTWLKRVRRRLAASGGISQAAMLLATETGGDRSHWRARLEAMLDGSEPPCIDMLTRIDSMLATPSAEISADPAQGLLFPVVE